MDAHDKIPISVSLVPKPCDAAENNLKVIDNQPPNGSKKYFGVCSKQMNYQDKNFAIRLIEWIHLLRILGVEKVHAYNRFVHPDTIKVFKYFEEKDWLEIQPFLEISTTDFALTKTPMPTIEKNSSTIVSTGTKMFTNTLPLSTLMRFSCLSWKISKTTTSC
jgi:Glycosyltransferase family 92